MTATLSENDAFALLFLLLAIVFFLLLLLIILVLKRVSLNRVLNFNISLGVHVLLFDLTSENVHGVVGVIPDQLATICTLCLIC